MWIFFAVFKKGVSGLSLMLSVDKITLRKTVKASTQNHCVRGIIHQACSTSFCTVVSKAIKCNKMIWGSTQSLQGFILWHFLDDNVSTPASEKCHRRPQHKYWTVFQQILQVKEYGIYLLHSFLCSNTKDIFIKNFLVTNEGILPGAKGSIFPPKVEIRHTNK